MKDSLRYNFVVSVLDGAFFGWGLGLASFVTVIPLFVASLAGSAALIGLAATIHTVGWQLPQLLTGERVSRMARVKPLVLKMTIHERLPFLGLAGVAWLIPVIGVQAGLVSTFGILTWQGLGGGFTATGWQSMIGKIIPPRRWGTFFGVQSAAANLFAAVGALSAGLVLDRVAPPNNFALCFLGAFVAMVVSFGFLSLVREEPSQNVTLQQAHLPFWDQVKDIMRRDVHFRWFLATRWVIQFATMAVTFYSVYAASRLGANAETVGTMTAAFLATQVVANPLMGWLGDRFGNFRVLQIAMLCATVSALIAVLAPDPVWFYLVFVLSGIGNVGNWTLALSMTLAYGEAHERPAYIGLGNTLVAPATILAPFLGGTIADWQGYPAAFWVSVATGLVSIWMIQGLKRPIRDEG